MDLLLLTLTIVSLVAALGFGAFAWHLLREERRRSQARVAALAAAIDTDAPPAFHTVAGAARLEPVAVSSLFAAEPSAAQGSPRVKIALAAVVAASVIAAIAVVYRPSAPPGASGTAVAARSTADAPLELVSMGHTRESGTLTVTGLVRNPYAGGDLTRVSATVLAYNRAGALVGTGRAPLDITTLAPGDESPFVVRIPGVADVSRYRVSFRTERGVVRHIDRRGDQMRLVAAVHSQ